MKKLICIIFALSIVFTALNITAFGANRESEDNNDYTKADMLSVNETITGATGDGNDSDWYKFTLSKAGYISLTFDHSIIASTSKYWQVCLYGSDGVTGVTGSPTSWYVTGSENLKTCEIGLEKGTYYIKVIPYSRRTYESSEYKLSVKFTASDVFETENNSEYGKADDLSLNKAYSGSCVDGSDNDWYHFRLASDGVVSIDFTHTITASTNKLWVLHVYQSNGTAGLTDNTTGWYVTGDKDLTTAKIGLKKGDYYIRISTYSSHTYSDSTYKIKVNFTSSDTWEKEANDSYEKATVLPLDTDFYGSSCVAGDNDWYKLVLDKAGTVTFSFTHTISATTNKLWDVCLYSSNGTDGIVGEDCTFYVQGDANAILPPLSLSAGTYYIKIFPYSKHNMSHETYTLKASFEEAGFSEVEPNGKAEKATVIETNKEYTGSLFTGTEEDWYKFTLDAESDVILSFARSRENESVNVTLYGSNGSSTIDSASLRNTVGREAKLFGTLAAGTYYVKIKAYSSYSTELGTYGLTILADHKHTSDGNWTITSKPSCEREGKKQSGCTVCGGICEEVVSAEGHTYGEWSVVYDAGCEYDGEKVCRCEKCNKSVYESIPALGHDFSDWTVTREATCSMEGLEESVCTRCGFAKRNYLEMLGHTYGKAERISGNIFDYPMIYERVCVDCGRIDTYEDNKARWAAPVIIVGGILLVGLLVLLIVLKVRKNMKAYAASQNAYAAPFVPPYGNNGYGQYSAPDPSAGQTAAENPVNNTPAPAPAAVPAAPHLDANGNIVCTCGQTNFPDSKFCCKCGKKLN